MAARKQTGWLAAFEEFVGEMRITSKEVSSQDERGVKLEMWQSQKVFLQEIAKGLEQGQRIFLCCKSRQLGITTISLALDVFWLAMHPNLNMALVTDDEAKRNANRNLLRRYVQSFPESFFGDEFFVVKGGDNRNFMQFSNGSRLTFLVAGVKKKGSAWAQGSGFGAAHLTECATYGDPAALESFEESFAQSNPDRLYIYESTSNGFNHWRTKWRKAEEDPITQRAFFCGWYMGDLNRIPRSDPRFRLYGLSPASGDEREKIATVAHRYGIKISPEQLAWIRWKTDQSDDSEMTRQNQPWLAEDSFVLSGFSFFAVRQITQDMKNIEANPDEFMFQAYRYNLGENFFHIELEMLQEGDSLDTADLRVWEEPVKGARYVLGCDTAYGRNDHGDRNVISVWRCYADKIVQVAEFASNKIEIKQCAWVLAHLAGVYEDCVVNVEVNGPGQGIITEWEHLRQSLGAEMNEVRVKELGWEDALWQARWYLYRRPDSMGAGYAVGFTTVWKSKMDIMNQLRGNYVTHELHIRSMLLLAEMRNVIQDGSEIGAPESSDEDAKDDRVFASALANRAWINWVRASMVAEGLTYDRVTKLEQGRTTPVLENLNAQVFRFFKSREELAQMGPIEPRWKTDRYL